MTVQVFGPEATVTYLNCAFFGTAPTYNIFTNQAANAQLIGDMAFANAWGGSFAGLSHSALAKLVLTNMGILSTTGTNSPSAQLLLQALTDYFAAYGIKTIGSNGQITADTRGSIVLQLAILLAESENTEYDAAAKAWNDEIAASYTYSSNPNHISTSSLLEAGNICTLTTGVDAFTGSASIDIFDANQTNTLSTFDNLDGGGGIDTLNAFISTPTATGIPPSVSIKNIEKINLNITGAAGVPFTVTASTLLGVTDFTINNASGGITVVGGSVVNTYAGNTSSTQTVNISGSTLTDVSAKGGTVTIDNKDAAGASGAGTSLHTITLTALTSDAILEGRAITSVTWKNQTMGCSVSITDDATTALTVNADGIGYDNAGNTVVDWVMPGSATTSVTLDATGTKSNVAIDGSTAPNLKNLTIMGSAELNLSSGAIPDSITKIDGSTATGNLSIDTTGLVATTNIVTGTGSDTITLIENTTGIAINLGAGDDTLTGSATLTSPQILDAGDGNDTVSLDILTRTSSGTLSQFKNFEAIDTGTMGGNLDINQLTGSAIKGLILSSPMTSATISNLPVGLGLTVSGQVASTTAGGSNDLRLANTSGNTDSFTVTFAGWDTSLISDGAILVINGIENITVESGGATKENRLSLSDNTLQTVTITGDQIFNLTLTNANGTAPTSASDTVNGIRLLDGSAATGNLTINASNLNTANLANIGLTIRGGSGDDMLTGTTKADTIIGNAGADIITGGRGADTITISGNTSTISMVAGDDSGFNNATATQTALLASNFDVITGAVAGIRFTLGSAGVIGTPGIGLFATTLATSATTSSNLATDLQGVDNAVVMARGTYDAVNGIFSYGANGSDTAMTYDWNNTPAITSMHTVILVGYTPSSTAASFTLGTATTAATLTLA